MDKRHYQTPLDSPNQRERPRLSTDDTFRPISRRSQWLARVWRFVGVMLLISALIALVYVGYIGYNVAKISTTPLQLGGLTSDENGRVNVLVLGVGDPGHSGEGLSDTVMVLSIDKRTKRVAQISLPRDMRVQIPDYGNGKINVAHAVGGVPLAEQVVANTLKIPIHYYVRANFTGLVQLVDSVGGIDVDVKERLRDPEYPCDKDQYKSCGLDIRPGLQHMDGAMALKYARCRKGSCGDDFGRAARQQEILNLVRNKAAKWDIILRPADLSKELGAVRSGVQTDMGAVQMVMFLRLWQESKQNQPVSLVLSTAQDGYLKNDPSSSDLIPVGGSFSNIQERVGNIFESR